MLKLKMNADQTQMSVTKRYSARLHYAGDICDSNSLISQSKLFPFATEKLLKRRGRKIQAVAVVGLRVLKGQGLELNHVSSQNVAVH